MPERVRESTLKPIETFLRQAAPLGTLTGVAVMYYTPDGEFQMYVQDGDVLFDRADIQVCSVPAACLPWRLAEERLAHHVLTSPSHSRTQHTAF